MRKLSNGVWTNEVRSEDGATVTVTDHGAHVLSWISADGEEALYMSGHSGFGGSAAIRGGVPIIFPQFSERGTGKRHGFARTAGWRLEFAGTDNGKGIARYALNDADVPGNAWPHRFAMRFEVAVSGQELRMTLSVSNPSQEAWAFNAALHSYWHVSDVERIRISGLNGLAYLDQVAGGTHAVQQEETLRIAGEVDRIYGRVPGIIDLIDEERILVLSQQGFTDAVIWNPGAEKAASLADLTPGGYKSFVCVEAGAILQPVMLAPGQDWQGSQTASMRKT